MTLPSHKERESAEETLAYIRQTMESASTFTALSGWGLVGVGCIGLLASWLAWTSGAGPALGLWVPTAVVSMAVAGISNAAKARRIEVPLWSGSLRKVAWVMAPALTAGAMLTYALMTHADPQVLPGTWLALYGAGVTGGGTFSIRAIRWMGLVLLGLGALALAHPAWGILYLALGFGVLHILFGLYIARQHRG